MEDKALIAVKLFEEGYNCAQSVFAAFCEETGMPKDEALRLTSSMGAGMGRLREVCGAVSSMFLIAGLLYGYTTPNDDIVKAEHYARIQLLAEQFQQKHGSIICRTLLEVEGKQSPVPQARNEQYYSSRPCSQFVADAAKIIADYIENHKVK